MKKRPIIVLGSILTLGGAVAARGGAGFIFVRAFGEVLDAKSE